MNKKRSPLIVRPKNLVVKVAKYSDRIDCQECGGSYINLSFHVSQKHDKEEYIRKFNPKTWYSEDYRKHMAKNCQKMGISKNAVDARSKYWGNDEVIKNKSEWMKNQMKKNMKDADYLSKWLPTLGKTGKKRFKIVSKKSKKCLVCGSVFKPKFFVDKKGWKHHNSYDVGKGWERKKYCSRSCVGKSNGTKYRDQQKDKDLT